MKAFLNAVIFTGKRFVKNQSLLIHDKTIQKICPASKLPKGIQKIDCNGGYLVPGFVDLQIYGTGKILFSQYTDLKSLNSIADKLVKAGTTAFYITLATNSFEVFEKAAEVVNNCRHPAVRGIHLEGPFINPEKRGAHIVEYIKKPDYHELKSFLKKAGGVVKMMTLAPEMCDKKILGLLRENGVLISAGHSNATFQEGQKGFEGGIRTVTHLYNAMSPLHHRKPGLAGAVFLDSRAMSSIIPDGIHVDFKMVEIARKQMGERLFYITDAVAECKEGPYQHIRQKDRYALPDGTLSGSAITMVDAVRNGVKYAGIELEESLLMASEYPARLAGFEKDGEISCGKSANLNCLSQDLKLKFTVFNGEIV